MVKMLCLLANSRCFPLDYPRPCTKCGSIKQLDTLLCTVISSWCTAGGNRNKVSWLWWFGVSFRCFSYFQFVMKMSPNNKLKFSFRHFHTIALRNQPRSVNSELAGYKRKIEVLRFWLCISFQLWQQLDVHIPAPSKGWCLNPQGVV